MKKILFRMHNQDDDSKVKEVIEFTKGYFDLHDEKVKLSYSEFKLSPKFAQPEGKMFDLFIHTSDENKARIAHAAAWTWVTCKQGV